MTRVTSARSHSVALFVAVTFAASLAVTLLPVDEANRFVVLAALLVPIPTVVAIVLAALNGSARAFLSETLRRRPALNWVIIALGLALGARLLVGILAWSTGATSGLTLDAPAPALIVMIYLFALLEEIGWRGFALRRLVRRYSPFAALLITGLPWSAIHIFFYLAQGESASTVLLVFLVNFALTVMVTWVYLRSGENVWVGTVLHGSQTLFAVLNANIPPGLVNQYSVVGYGLIAIALVAADWRRWVSRPQGAMPADVVPVPT